MAELWPIAKEALSFLLDRFGPAGGLLAVIAIWFGVENWTLKKRVIELSDKLIETGDKSTATLITAADQRLDLLAQIEALNTRIEKQAPKGRGR